MKTFSSLFLLSSSLSLNEEVNYLLMREEEEE
jgi:hypothetical protein